MKEGLTKSSSAQGGNLALNELATYLHLPKLIVYVSWRTKWAVQWKVSLDHDGLFILTHARVDNLINILWS